MRARLVAVKESPDTFLLSARVTNCVGASKLMLVTIASTAIAPPAVAVRFIAVISRASNVGLKMSVPVPPILPTALMVTVPLTASMSRPPVLPPSITPAEVVIVTAVADALVVTSRPSVMLPPSVPAALIVMVPLPPLITAPSVSSMSSSLSPFALSSFAVSTTAPPPVAVIAPVADRVMLSSAVNVTAPAAVVITDVTDTSLFVP